MHRRARRGRSNGRKYAVDAPPDRPPAVSVHNRTASKTVRVGKDDKEVEGPGESLYLTLVIWTTRPTRATALPIESCRSVPWAGCPDSKTRVELVGPTYEYPPIAKHNGICQSRGCYWPWNTRLLYSGLARSKRSLPSSPERGQVLGIVISRLLSMDLGLLY